MSPQKVVQVEDYEPFIGPKRDLQKRFGGQVLNYKFLRLERS